MAEVLKIFQEGEDILASETNANNNYLLGKISDNASTLQNYVEGEVTSIQSSLASVQATLQNSINEMSNKLSSIYDNIAPNRSAGYSIASGWTAPKAGWVNARHYQPYDNQYLTLWIDGAVVFETGNAGSHSAGDTGQAEFFVNKGSNVTFDGSGNIRVIFFPCKGV